MTAAHVDLLWLPVGAGGHVVVHTSRWWEQAQARREHRAPRPLFHAALEAFVGGSRHVIEMGPAWGMRDPSRGVLVTGPVAMRVLGRSRLFRYEVRCWRDGDLPDRAFAVGTPTRFAMPEPEARALLRRVADVPVLTWGRDALGVGDMWNSNSLVSWLLQTSGVDAAAIVPPDNGSAPGWASGLAAARLTPPQGR